MEQLSWYVYATFGIALFVALALFNKAAGPSKAPLMIVLSLIIIQSILGLTGFYGDTAALTSRFPLLVFPSLALGASLFFTSRGRAFLDSLDIATLTLLHVIRIGVELVLFWLYAHQEVPRAMTFEGRNFDVLSGLTAPLVYYFGFIQRRLGKGALIAWNITCILLLLNVVSSAFLSLPGRFRNFGFEQPNIAVGSFPFLLLPAILVPLVLFSHAVTIRRLVRNKK
jgi:hypothetical protein